MCFKLTPSGLLGAATISPFAPTTIIVLCPPANSIPLL